MTGELGTIHAQETAVNYAWRRRALAGAASSLLLLTGCGGVIDSSTDLSTRPLPTTASPSPSPSPTATETPASSETEETQQARPERTERDEDKDKDKDEDEERRRDREDDFFRVGPGKSGKEVTVVQNLLKDGNCLPGSFKPDGEVSKSPNSMTFRAIKSAQGVLKLETDGWWGPDTDEKFKERLLSGKDICKRPVKSVVIKRADGPGCDPKQQGPYVPGTRCSDGSIAGVDPAGCGNNYGPGIAGTRCRDGYYLGDVNSPECGVVAGPAARPTICPDGKRVGPRP